MKAKKDFNDVSLAMEELHVMCSLKVTDEESSRYGYTFYLQGGYLTIDYELTADELYKLMKNIEAALKATGEWKGGEK